MFILLDTLTIKKFILKKIIPYRNTTQWDYIIDTWNQYNPSHMINPKKINQPNYTTINEPK